MASKMVVTNKICIKTTYQPKTGTNHLQQRQSQPCGSPITGSPDAQCFADQSGKPDTHQYTSFMGAEWGNGSTFAPLTASRMFYQKDGHNWNVYHDPGPPPLLDPQSVVNSTTIKHLGMVKLQWSRTWTPTTEWLIDISPKTLGNSPEMPNDISGHNNFYDYMNGGHQEDGFIWLIPVTGQPYTPNWWSGVIMPGYWLSFGRWTGLRNASGTLVYHPELRVTTRCLKRNTGVAELL